MADKISGSVDFSERSQLPAAVREFLVSAAVCCFCCSVVFCVLATDVVLQLSDVRIWRSRTSSTTIWVSWRCALCRVFVCLLMNSPVLPTHHLKCVYMCSAFVFPLVDSEILVLWTCSLSDFSLCFPFFWTLVEGTGSICSLICGTSSHVDTLIPEPYYCPLLKFLWVFRSCLLQLTVSSFSSSLLQSWPSSVLLLPWYSTSSGDILEERTQGNHSLCPAVASKEGSTNNRYDRSTQASLF